MAHLLIEILKIDITLCDNLLGCKWPALQYIVEDTHHIYIHMI